MSINIKHPGALHHEMHVKKGKKIPMSQLEQDLRSAKKRHDVKRERQDVFAINARHFHHGGGKAPQSRGR